jgi:hypothetical protein
VKAFSVTVTCWLPFTPPKATDAGLAVSGIGVGEAVGVGVGDAAAADAEAAADAALVAPVPDGGAVAVTGGW